MHFLALLVWAHDKWRRRSFWNKLRRPDFGFRVVEGGGCIWRFEQTPLMDEVGFLSGPVVDIVRIVGMPFARFRAAIPEDLIAGSLAQSLGRHVGLCHENFERVLPKNKALIEVAYGWMPEDEFLRQRSLAASADEEAARDGSSVGLGGGMGQRVRSRMQSTLDPLDEEGPTPMPASPPLGAGSPTSIGTTTFSGASSDQSRSAPVSPRGAEEEVSSPSPVQQQRGASDTPSVIFSESPGGEGSTFSPATTYRPGARMSPGGSVYPPGTVNVRLTPGRESELGTHMLSGYGDAEYYNGDDMTPEELQETLLCAQHHCCCHFPFSPALSPAGRATDHDRLLSIALCD